MWCILIIVLETHVLNLKVADSSNDHYFFTISVSIFILNVLKIVYYKSLKNRIW